MEYNILGLFYRTLLAWLRVNRNFPMAMIIAPLSVSSLGLSLMEVQQIVEVIDLFISLYNLLLLVKFLLRDSLELLQLESELITPVLEENY